MVLLLATGAAHAGDPSLAAELARLRAADDTALAMQGRFEALERVYAEHFASRAATPALLSAGDRASAFEASDLMAFYALQASHQRLERYVADMSRLLDALDARGAVTARDAGNMFDALVSARAFDSARQLIERFPAKLAGRAIPHVEFAENFSADRPAIMELRVDGTLFTRNVDRTGDHLVAIVGCRQSQRALDRINDAPALVAQLAGLTTYWVLPAERMTDPAFLREWNTRYPGQPAAFVYRNSAWENVDFSSMPAFQRFDGERLVAAVKGYPREDDAGALDAILLPKRDAR